MTLSVEIYWLTLTCLLTALFWMPYTVQLIVQIGPIKALLDRHHEFSLDAMWARRAKRAHQNAIENLVIFASLVLAIEFLNAGNSTTALTCQVYFFARLAHYIVYSFGIPVVRTILFLVGFVSQIILALALIS